MKEEKINKNILFKYRELKLNDLIFNLTGKRMEDQKEKEIGNDPKESEDNKLLILLEEELLKMDKRISETNSSNITTQDTNLQISYKRDLNSKKIRNKIDNFQLSTQINSSSIDKTKIFDPEPKNSDDIKNNSTVDVQSKPNLISGQSTTSVFTDSNSEEIQSMISIVEKFVNNHSNSYINNYESVKLLFENYIEMSFRYIGKNNQTFHNFPNLNFSIDNLNTKLNYSNKINLIYGIEIGKFNSSLNLKKDQINMSTINSLNNQNQNAFIIACKKDSSLELINFIAELGVEVNIKDIYGKSILHYAIEFCSDSKVSEFFINKGLKVSEPDKNGKTVLHYACLFKSLDVIKKYVEYYKKEVEKYDFTLLEDAFKNIQNNDVIDYLFKNLFFNEKNLQDEVEEIIFAHFQKRNLLIVTNKSYNYYDQKKVLEFIKKY